MKVFLSAILTLAIIKLISAVPLRLQKRAAFYIANETACVVDNIVYSNGDPIPTDDPCEACKCRPPGFACVLKDCQVKPGCRAVRRVGHCCPEYICGCEHNGRMYRDGDEIRDSQNPCYTCHCQGSSIACAFVDCLFRVDCAPVYIPGECCPKYENCTDRPNDPFDSRNPLIGDKEQSLETTEAPSLITASKVEYVEDTSKTPDESVTSNVEIFEDETKAADLLQLDPEVIDPSFATVNETSTKKDDVLPPAENIEYHSGGHESAEIKHSSELPSEEDNTGKDDKNEDISVEKVEHGTEQLTESTSKTPITTLADLHYFTDDIKAPLKSLTEVSLEEEKSLTETSSQAEESSTEEPSKPEDNYSLVVTEIAKIEDKEVSNALESGNPSSSEYGKSLKFSDQEDDKAEESAKIQETTLVEVLPTSSPAAAKLEVTTEEVDRDSSNQTTDSEVLVKDLYYKPDETVSSELVETVTTIVHVKEQTQSTTTGETTPVEPSSTSEKAQLLRFDDSKLVAEEHNATTEVFSSTLLDDKEHTSLDDVHKELSASTDEDVSSTMNPAKLSEDGQETDATVPPTTKAEQDTPLENAE